MVNRRFYKVYTCVIEDFWYGRPKQNLVRFYCNQSLKTGYIYLSIDDDFSDYANRYGWMAGNETGYKFFADRGYEYKGEYNLKAVRKYKLDKLKIV